MILKSQAVEYKFKKCIACKRQIEKSLQDVANSSVRKKEWMLLLTIREQKEWVLPC